MSEYNIPVLVKWYANRPRQWNSTGGMDKYMGTVIMCRKTHDFNSAYLGPNGEYDGDGWYWKLEHVIPNPTQKQIKEEAVKAGKKSKPTKAPKAPKPSPLEKALQAAEEKIIKAQEHKAAIERIMAIDVELKEVDVERAKLRQERLELARKHLRGMK